MNELRTWFGDVFYKTVEDVVVTEGYESEYHGLGGGQYEIIELPYESTVTTTKNVIDWQSVSAVIFVVLTFVTCVTLFRKAILGR